MELRFENLVKDFSGTIAVNNLSLTVPDGKLTGLLGPSGCGKSTLLYMVAGLEQPTSGRIYFDGEDVTDVPTESRGIGLVFQNYALYPHMTVEENIMFPMLNAKVKKKEARARAREMAEFVQIEEYLKRKPAQLSGGQQQRVAIARALVKRPKVLLLDEPLSNLDARLRLELREEIRRIQREMSITTIFVTHDQEEATSITDEIVLMRKGVIQQVATPSEMYRDPANQFVASFLGNPPICFFQVETEHGVARLSERCSLRFDVDHTGAALLGIRPEAWRTGEDVEVEVKNVEIRGREQFITFELFGGRGLAILDNDSVIRPGDKVGLTIGRPAVYLFDAQSGERLDKGGVSYA